jgi:predicted site-specific integrase-resolvase
MPSIDLSGYPLLLKMKEAQAIMRCSEQTVRRRMRQGRLSYVRGENGPLILRESLQRYLEERLVPEVDESAAVRGERP